jgi:16S rRNA (cytosine967-C5)-methyltransferase
MSDLNRSQTEAWPLAARIIAQWLDRRERVDTLMDPMPKGLSSSDRARCQHLIYGVVRHYGRIESALGRLIAHPPRFATRAILYIAGYELIEAASETPESGKVAKIVHHAVEQAKHLSSVAESRLVNAVVRKLAPLMATEAPPKLATSDVLAEYFSHPEWLVKRWLLQLGAENTRQLLEWNQSPARAYVRWRDASTPAPDFLKPTQWENYYEIGAGRWSDVEPLLKSGAVYIQDPSTRLSVELLDLQAGETVLDLCAAPGGKSLLMADLMPAGDAPGKIVALDLPGERIERLKENLSKIEAHDVALVQADLLEGVNQIFRDHQLPTQYDAVLLDAPCTNTGVMRHRVDVKWRLQERDFRKHAQQQLALLHAAIRLVAPGGRLVYSTCSLDADENGRVLKEFFDSRAGGPFELEKEVQSFPWESGHDGAGAFLMRRS